MPLKSLPKGSELKRKTKCRTGVQVSWEIREIIDERSLLTGKILEIVAFNVERIELA